MKMEINIEDGTQLVKFARENILNYLSNGKRLEISQELRNKFGNKLGTFVTLNKVENDDKHLRGCIGYTLPVYPLIDAISNVSLSAALEDSRFSNVILEEMNEIAVEVSVLTEPKLLKVNKPEDYLDLIKIGRDGLYVMLGNRKGLLLPQVPVDHDRNWDVKTFLEHTCVKAWLPKDAWKDKNTKIYSFQGIIFEELVPNGEIIRKEI